MSKTAGILGKGEVFRGGMNRKDAIEQGRRNFNVSSTGVNRFLPF
ncbi:MULTISPECIES: hypothetical protein [Cyanophyceae]|nr:hypothetical protein [Trichocoleus sp. FACHB-40]